MNQNRAPLYEALRNRRMNREASFHVPGHKFGQDTGLPEAEHYSSIMGIDYTEIEGLDDLHHPQGVIAEAQQLAAACFGAEESGFLVGGSTVGNLALILSVCSPGELILVQRNAHKSVIHGLMLAGAQAVFLNPVIDQATNIAGCVSRETLEEALRKYPHAKAVLLTNPNYYGMARDLTSYADIIHQYGLPLLVDEAHGAHFGFHEKLPLSALAAGADAVVQSTHKMLTAMTMGAMLHIQGTRINRPRLKQQLAMLQSSSPSYPLMASLDLARRRIAIAGEQMIGQVLNALQLLNPFFQNNSSCFRLLRSGGTSPAYDNIDPFKLVLYDARNRLTGFQLLQELAVMGIVAEMADERHVVLACSPATSQHDIERFHRALRALEEKIAPDIQLPADAAQDGTAAAPELSLHKSISDPIAMSVKVWGEDETVRIPLQEAAGRQSAQFVIPYPPGVPLLFPGETIDGSAIEHIYKLIRSGAKFQGDQQSDGDCSILVEKER